MKFCQKYRHTNAKAATYPTLQPVTFCSCLYQQSSTKNCLGKRKERDTIHQLPTLAPLLFSSADFASLPRSLDLAMDLLWLERVCNSPLVSHMYTSPHHVPIHAFNSDIENRVRNCVTTKMLTIYDCSCSINSCSITPCSRLNSFLQPLFQTSRPLHVLGLCRAHSFASLTHTSACVLP